MKIYFTAAITQKDQLGEDYLRIIKILQKEGHSVQHEHITSTSMTTLIEESDEERLNYYRQALKWINQADIVVVEGSFPSTLNIGHEITISLNKGKPVIVFYKKGRDSFFLHGLDSEKLLLAEYTEDNLEEVVRSNIDYDKDQSDTRFNFFISPSLSHYLDWVSTNKKIPRSVYLRQLIEEDREKNREQYDLS